MTNSRYPKYVAPLVILTILLGNWMGHTLEVWQLTTSGYLIPGSVSTSPFGGVHNYMAGVGAVLLALSLIGSAGLWGVWWGLCQRLDRAGYLFKGLLRTGNPEGYPAEIDFIPSAQSRLLLLWASMATTQTTLYLLQENIEAVAQGRRNPGLSVLIGLHWAAPFFQAGISLFFAIAILVVTWPIRRKAEAVAATEQALVARVRALSRMPINPVRVSIPERIPTLADMFGANLWQRPPPLAA